ncbi:MAG: helix-turn-helix transcriptional regulator [Bacteroidota bacterium]|jgi:predicted DNA-binding transcriptional regulator YafY
MARAPEETVLKYLYGIIPVGKQIQMADIIKELNENLRRLDLSTIDSRNTIGLKLKILRDKGAPIMFGGDPDDVKKVQQEFGYRLGARSYTRLNSDFLLPIDLRPEEQQIFMESIETMLSLDFISSVKELKSLLTKIKVLGSTQVESRAVSLDVNYTSLRREDGSFANPLEHFEGLLKAIRTKKILWIEYRDFKGEEFKRYFQPVHIRESGDRWYLLCYDIDQKDLKSDPKLWTLGFERILRFNLVEDRRWIDSLFFNPHEHFADIVGVGRPWNQSPEPIRIKVKKDSVKYWQTKAIHSSQEISPPDEEGNATITFNLIPNKEFYEILYGQSKDLLDVEPADLYERYLRGRN